MNKECMVEILTTFLFLLIIAVVFAIIIPGCGHSPTPADALMEQITKELAKCEDAPEELYGAKRQNCRLGENGCMCLYRIRIEFDTTYDECGYVLARMNGEESWTIMHGLCKEYKIPPEPVEVSF